MLYGTGESLAHILWRGYFYIKLIIETIYVYFINKIHNNMYIEKNVCVFRIRIQILLKIIILTTILCTINNYIKIIKEIQVGWGRSPLKYALGMV